jgi:chromosome segregation ATPase
MRSLIFSPMGLKVIVMVKQRNLASYVQKNILDNVSMSIKNPENRVTMMSGAKKAEFEQYQKMQIESNKEDQSAELHTLRSVKEFLSQKLNQNQEILKSFQKDVARLTEELQKEKRNVQDLKKSLGEAELDRDEHQDNIKELNMKYQELIMEHETKTKELETENGKHQTHKKLLAEEIVKLRQEKEKVDADKQKYYDALLRIKNSFYDTKVFSHLQNKSSDAGHNSQMPENLIMELQNNHK